MAKKTPFQIASEKAARRGRVAEEQRVLRDEYAEASFMKRFRRAERELAALSAAWETWRDGVSTRTGTYNGTFRYYMSASHPLPETLQEHVGDCVEKLRSSLDQIIFELSVRANGGLSEQEERSTKFPIMSKAPQKVTKTTWQGIDLIPERARRQVQMLQPYVTHSELPQRAPLAILTTLAERSKHRTELTAATVAEPTVTSIGGSVYLSRMFTYAGDLTNGGEALLFESEVATARQFHIGANCDLRFAGTSSVYDGEEVIPTLERLLHYVDVEVFGRLLRALRAVSERRSD